MPRYKVEVRETTQQVCYIEVEASSPTEADEKACELASEGVDEAGKELEWDYISDTGFEAYDIEEVKVQKRRSR